ncbi:MAG: glucokinase [Labilithrix sp.]|nr:glucokinase [Labilithrix sp.]
MILAGDVGGTRARFALLDPKGKRVAHQAVLGSRGFRTFETALDAFLEGARAEKKLKGAIVAASFGIAGPVVEQRVKATNLPWTIDARAIAREFDIVKVTLLNDLVAVGLGALACPPKKLAVIKGGAPQKKGGNLAVIAAGTGLGEAAFVWDGRGHVACPTEGAHVDFAPRDDLQLDLWRALARTHGHVSYEHVAAGSSIGVLYDFLVKSKRVKETATNAARISRAADRNVAIVDLALQGASEAAMRAIELWSALYGAEAGNLALKTLATAGVFVCGGASARLASVLARGVGRGRRPKLSPFLEAFVDKGRMRGLLEKVPVAVVLEPLAGLLGAAGHAARQAGLA